MSPRATIRAPVALTLLVLLVAIDLVTQAAQKPTPSDADRAQRSDSSPPLASGLPSPALATASPAVSTSSGVSTAPASPPIITASTSPGTGSGTPPTIDALVPGAVNRTSINLSAEYRATIKLDFGTRSFRVSSTMTVTNTSGAAIDRLELNTIAARLGRMTITLARSGGRDVHPTVTDQTIHFPLGGTLPPGATVTVRIDYRAILRGDTVGSNWLFTRANGVLEAHRWLPWISLPRPFDRPNHGDPFVTPVSPRVRVTIVSDRRILWATTGEPTTAAATAMSFEARDVRDFVIVGAPDYKTVSATVDGVAIHVWYRPGFRAATVLAAAKAAISREARLLGPYPYTTYDIAETAGGFGMEAPGLTWIPARAGSLTYLVAHETAHQWFYGIVGNDQARQPYADEAATDFVARYALRLRRASSCSTARLDLTIYQYSSACYYEDIYIQGGNFLDDTRKAMGSTPFWAAIREYLATYRFKLGSTRALLDTLDAHTPLTLVTRYHSRFPSLY
ncbi:MAG: hypothetical protein ABJC39_04860 [Chloroflexota bacterium]